MRLFPFGLVALEDQQPAMNGRTSITVIHENLRVGVGLSQATPHPEVLLHSNRDAATNVQPGFA